MQQFIAVNDASSHSPESSVPSSSLNERLMLFAICGPPPERNGGVPSGAPSTASTSFGSSSEQGSWLSPSAVRLAGDDVLDEFDVFDRPLQPQESASVQTVARQAHGQRTDFPFMRRPPSKAARRI